MKHRSKNLLLVFVVAFLFSSCDKTKSNSDPLPSWYETEMKTKLIQFVENVVPTIPVEDRIAVFDMDGTIACEQPLWMEMYCAVQGLCLQVEKDSTLIQQAMYQYAVKLAENPKDTSVTNSKEYAHAIDTMIHSAFVGWANEDYIKFCENYLSKAVNPDYPIALDETFYPPMFEVLEYLKDNEFEIYIVSGSLQGLVWSVCPKAIGFDRKHLIGTHQTMDSVVYRSDKTDFILKPTINLPKNDKDGKSQNIYSQIGKTPVFAFGNTTGDFGMFHLTTTNTLPNICFLVNHDDAVREYKYDPWHGKSMPHWRDTMLHYGWNIVDMSTNFEVVFE